MAALPAFSSRRALPGWTGVSGCLAVSTTKTFDMVSSFVLCPCGPLVSQVMLTSTACASGFLSRAPASPSTPFNPGPQWSELVKHSDVPVDIGHAAFAGNGAREKEHAPFPWLSLLMFWACEQRERSSQAPAFDAGVHDY